VIPDAGFLIAVDLEERGARAFLTAALGPAAPIIHPWQ